MRIFFTSNKLQKTFKSEKNLRRAYGAERAKKILARMKVLEAAANLAQVSAQKPERKHPLEGDRKGQFAVDLVHPYRLIFEPVDETPRLPDGGIDQARITAIAIRGVEDYHGD